MRDGVENVTLVSEKTRPHLTERQLLDYEEYKRDLVEWLYHVGKDPDYAEGYAYETVRAVSYKVDLFYRWLWSERDGYTTRATHEDADEFMQHLVYSDKDYGSGTMANIQKCLKRLFKWKRHERDGTKKWEPKHTFSHPVNQPRDFLTIEERQKIREAALEYGSIPHYNSVSGSERDEWKAYLAQRFEKPKSEVTRKDWDRANGWKIPSMVWVSLDAGLRPIEVGRATVRWVDVENNLLRIPKEESSKNTENWQVAISDRTASALERWLVERENYDTYEGTDTLWLTNQQNPYGSQSLKYVMTRLCEIANIDAENRSLSWYAIRHSVGTYMTREEDLAAAQAQLRHKSPETTMRYDQTPVEDRRDALDKIG